MWSCLSISLHGGLDCLNLSADGFVCGCQLGSSLQISQRLLCVAHAAMRLSSPEYRLHIVLVLLEHLHPSQDFNIASMGPPFRRKLSHRILLLGQVCTYLNLGMWTHFSQQRLNVVFILIQSIYIYKVLLGRCIQPDAFTATNT